ncbi:hypothetical protein SLS62_001852 [Diatrype stigma]|uniref:Uncharacterized protein n=1 Tax=Diatrype stigma TaxID=117547 RepID=A0AAN9YVK6_9PEZI
MPYLDSKEVARYTYVSTHEHPSHKITLFKDLVARSGETTSKTESINLGPGQAVTFLSPIKPLRNEPGVANDSLREELVVVRGDGEIIGLDIESLQKKWVSPSKTLYKGVVDSSAGLHGTSTSNSKDDFKVEFCCSALASDVVQGIFKGNEELLSLFPGERLENKTDSEVLVLISSHGADDNKIRNFHVVGLSPQSASHTGQRVTILYTGPLPARPHQTKSGLSYHLDALSGTFLELDDQTLATYDLTTSVPRVSTEVALGETSSFLRLSKTSLLSSSGNKLKVYNPVYRSLQSSTTIELEGQSQVSIDGASIPAKCQLVAYFSRLELAIAIINSNLVAIQLEAPKTRAKKRRAEGLLIDSIGRGVPSVDRDQTTSAKEVSTKSAFSRYLPGSVKGDYWEKWNAQRLLADGLLNSNDVAGLEKFLAEKFGVAIREKEPTSIQDAVGEDANVLETLPRWKWPKNRTAYPYADRRWILYAISRAFEWNSALPDDETIPRLVCQLPQSNIVNYLVDAGHMTLSNIKSAFKLNMNETEKTDSFIAEQLITRLVDLDPSFALLSAYISATTLDSTELLLAVRIIMRSLELIQDRHQNPPKLLADSADSATTEAVTADNDNDNDNDNGAIGMELDNLEEQIQKTESYLNNYSGDAGVRGAALSAAFAKLGGCPTGATIGALRASFKPEEILSLVYVLRVELVKGAWTSRYLDTTDFERDPRLDAPPDGVIKLLADLLGRCIDAIGPSGWLLNDAILAGSAGVDGGAGGEASDFVAALKLEVSAALEGLEEAVYLRGIVGEAVRYCQVVEKQQHHQGRNNNSDDTAVANVTEGVVNKNQQPIIPLPIHEPGAEALPLGLKTGRDRISAQKIAAGGEIVERSARETGHLRSQQVGAYSLERIAI